jgi:hypothetical protein
MVAGSCEKRVFTKMLKDIGYKVISYATGGNCIRIENIAEIEEKAKQGLGNNNSYLPLAVYSDDFKNFEMNSFLEKIEAGRRDTERSMFSTDQKKEITNYLATYIKNNYPSELRKAKIKRI